jgi:hypothetical protein
MMRWTTTDQGTPRLVITIDAPTSGAVSLRINGRPCDDGYPQAIADASAMIWQMSKMSTEKIAKLAAAGAARSPKGRPRVHPRPAPHDIDALAAIVRPLLAERAAAGDPAAPMAATIAIGDLCKLANERGGTFNLNPISRFHPITEVLDSIAEHERLAGRPPLAALARLADGSPPKGFFRNHPEPIPAEADTEGRRRFWLDRLAEAVAFYPEADG